MVNILAGDVFAVNSKSIFSDIINFVAGLNSSDGNSIYNHAGIITSSDGQTFEALKRIDYYGLSNYKGRKIIIARPKIRTHKKEFQAMVRVILDHKGQLYPFWRLPLYIHPAIARNISYKGKYVVCSDIVAKYLNILGIRPQTYTGTTPDALADEWVHWKEYDVIFQGVLE